MALQRFAVVRQFPHDFPGLLRMRERAVMFKPSGLNRFVVGDDIAHEFRQNSIQRLAT